MTLVISNTKKVGTAVCEILYYMGILSHYAAPTSTHREISEKYRAVLIINPESKNEYSDMLRDIRRRNTEIPVFSVSDKKLDIEKSYHTKSYENTSFSTKIAVDIINEMASIGLSPIGEYRLAGIDASSYNRAITRFDTEIPFTQTEAMILRYLIRSYPNPSSTRDILRFAYRQTKVPEAACVRTHLSVMNRKFREACGVSLTEPLIEGGYLISTPKYANLKK